MEETRRKWQYKEMEKVIDEIGEYKKMKAERKLTDGWDARYEKNKKQLQGDSHKN